MQLKRLHIRNFKSVRNMDIIDIENALILVGKNNTGKTTVLDAIRAAFGCCQIGQREFNEKKQNIEIDVSLALTEEDLHMLHRRGIVSQYKRYELWKQDFCFKLPSYQNELLEFTFSVNWEGRVRYSDGAHKDNRFIPQMFPKVYYIDTQRELQQLQDDLLMFQDDALLKQMRSGCCMFDMAKQCNHCFQCIGLINQKNTADLNVFETARLLEYKLYQLNLSDFTGRVNENFRKNGGYEEIQYTLNCDADQMFRVSACVKNRENGSCSQVEQLSKGMRSIYMLSLLETYVGDDGRIPSMILVEDPESFLHPQLQKIAGEILYRLSKKNQVVFTTHSPNLLFNFNSRQIRQVVLDQEYYSVVKEKTDIGTILDDLGYTANDVLNVGFVFIVEGKQDKSRLPLLLEKYYSEMYDQEGRLSGAAIITTNSCTNIKTYANLKYMNRIYLRDQFLMIRDGDGQDAEKLAGQLCRYYDERGAEDADKLPKVTRRNVLILKYYSFENYFLNPSVMAELGIIPSEKAFYKILLKKWQEYLYRIQSGKHLREILGKDLETEEDIRSHMEEIKIYLRGHNLFDIFYGRWRAEERELLRRYIDLAPREDFRDILEAIDRFAYFDSKKITENWEQKG